MIRYQRPTTFDTLGRNGYTRSCGMTVSRVAEEIFLEPINAHGKTGRARLVIHADHVPDLIDALIAKMKEIENGQGLRP